MGCAASTTAAVTAPIQRPDSPSRHAGRPPNAAAAAAAQLPQHSEGSSSKESAGAVPPALDAAQLPRIFSYHSEGAPEGSEGGSLRRDPTVNSTSAIAPEVQTVNSPHSISMTAEEKPEASTIQVVSTLHGSRIDEPDQHRHSYSSPQAGEQLALLRSPPGAGSPSISFLTEGAVGPKEYSDDPEGVEQEFDERQSPLGMAAEEPGNPLWWQDEVFVNSSNDMISIPVAREEATERLRTEGEALHTSGSIEATENPPQGTGAGAVATTKLPPRRRRIVTKWLDHTIDVQSRQPTREPILSPNSRPEDPSATPSAQHA